MQRAQNIAQIFVLP